jgi:hypothetical protein
MFYLPQLAPIQVQTKVHSEFSKFSQEVERQDLVTVRIRENAHEALDGAALVSHPPQELPVSSECSEQALQKRHQFPVLADLNSEKRKRLYAGQAEKLGRC